MNVNYDYGIRVFLTSNSSFEDEKGQTFDVSGKRCDNTPAISFYENISAANREKRYF